MFLPRPLLCVVAFLSLLFPRFTSAQIRADVTVAGAVTGTFTIDLEYAKVPTTVASFIGLATGQRGWIDFASGAIRNTPFYNGVTFHRVIAGFMSQTGSRNGLGTDGPGYFFKDEFDASLRHDGAYVVSMANSGKHTNGSQLFITAAAQPHLNDKHSVFGRVIAGQAICDAINSTPTGVGDVPVTPIVIQSIDVYGASLAGFDLFPATLPTVLNANPVLTRSGTTYTLAYEAHTYSGYTGYRSGDLSAWILWASSYFGGTPPVPTSDVTSLATGTRHFFRLARTDYSTTAARFVPANLASRTFTFTSNLPWVVVVTLDATGVAGSWTLQGTGSGTLLSTTYTPGRLTPTSPSSPRYPFYMSMRLLFDSTSLLGNNFDFRPSLDYATATSGTFTGTSNYPGYSTVTGTFTTSP
jgi:peptidyl-prolyl cis-trans isomerase A (cyclophilin A)